MTQRPGAAPGEYRRSDEEYQEPAARLSQPAGDTYSQRGDSYPPADDRFPPADDSYPPADDTYPPAGDSYPPAGDTYPPADDSYPPAGDTYPPADDGYPLADEKYISPDRYAELRDLGAGDGGFVPGLEPAARAREGRGRKAGRSAQPASDELDPGERGGGSGEPPDGGPPAGKRPRKRGRGRMAALIAVLVIIVPLVVGGIYGYRVIAAHYFPADYSGAGTGQVTVQINSGDSAEVIGQRLFSKHVVASARAFVLAAEDSKQGSALEPGFYRVHEHMNAKLAFSLLLKPSSRVQLKVTLPEGLRVSQVITALAKSSGIQSGNYQQALRNTASLGLPAYAHGNPEGYLFPATYEIQPNMTAASVLQAMVKRFDVEAASVDLPQAAARGHLTPAEAIIVASLAQAEGGKDSDFPKITRVIYNRIAAGMTLDLDSTVLYALHTYGILASDQQLKVNSPYNTYAHKDLPPGPIDSPGDAAIRAALHPAAGNWLYFVTVNPKTKETDFTASPAVFAQLKAELERNLAHGG